MEKTSAQRRQPRLWRFWKLCTPRIRSPRAMLFKTRRSVKARFRHGRHGYVRVPCPDSVLDISACDHIDAGSCSVDLSARLARSSKCLSKPDRRLAARGVFEWPHLSVARCRLPTRHTRSSTTHGSHAEAPSVDDGRCSLDSSGGTDVYHGVRPSEILHADVSSTRQFAVTMARTLRSASCVVLAGGHGSRDRMACSRCVSVGHAFFRNAHFGGPVLSGGRPFVLVAYRAVSATCCEVASMVDASLPLPCHPAL